VLETLAQKGVRKSQELCRCDETSLLFESPLYFASGRDWVLRTLETTKRLADEATLALREIDQAVYNVLGKSPDDVAQIESVAPSKLDVTIEWPDVEADLAGSLMSYSVGAAFGRWDLRHALHKQKEGKAIDPLAPLSACAPGMLGGRDGLPETKTPDDYPLSINWDGIMVDASDHPNDIVRRVREVLEVI
jgi:hypothetical protein